MFKKKGVKSSKKSSKDDKAFLWAISILLFSIILFLFISRLVEDRSLTSVILGEPDESALLEQPEVILNESNEVLLEEQTADQTGNTTLGMDLLADMEKECDQLIDMESKSRCYAFVAVETGDSKKCNRLGDAFYKDKCLQAASGEEVNFYKEECSVDEKINFSCSGNELKWIECVEARFANKKEICSAQTGTPSVVSSVPWAVTISAELGMTIFKNGGSKVIVELIKTDSGKELNKDYYVKELLTTTKIMYDEIEKLDFDGHDLICIRDNQKLNYECRTHISTCEPTGCKAWPNIVIRLSATFAEDSKEEGEKLINSLLFS